MQIVVKRIMKANGEYDEIRMEESGSDGDEALLYDSAGNQIS